jgi:exonuclease V gamma subunit
VVHQLSALPHPKEINFWIHHLVLSQLAPQNTPRSSYLVGRKGDGADVLTLPPCDDPEPVLRDLLELYALGQTLPLPLLRRTSLGYAKECVGKEWGRPSPSVVRGWNASFSGGTPADREDFYLAQAFRDIDPLDPEAPLPGVGFSELARRVYEPYLQALASDK